MSVAWNVHVNNKRAVTAAAIMITATITIDGTIAASTIYMPPDFASATITDSDPYRDWTRALGRRSYIQTDAAGDVRTTATNPDVNCGGMVSGWWIGAPTSNTPEPSSSGLLLIGAAVFLAGRQRFTMAFRTACYRK